MRRLSVPVLLFCALLHAQTALAQFGLQFNGVGPVNRGMGGVATATPTDAIGAIHWNPATISALDPEMAFGVDAILPVVQLNSSIEADALGAGAPPVRLSGSSDSDNGWFAAPSFGLIHRNEGSPWTFGLGIMTVAGFGENFQASPTNPILFPDDPAAGAGIPGFGNVFAEALFFEIAPVISAKIADNISIGAGPTIGIGRVQTAPFAFGSPDDANGNGTATFAEGTHSRFHWGGGYQLGAYMTTQSCWNFGLSFKSPQYFENFTYNSSDELGNHGSFQRKVDLPYILGIGTSYDGIQNTIIGVDVRYIGWSEADLFGDPAVFNADASLRGLGWDDQWTVAIGAQHHLTECITVRAGYAHGRSPIDGAGTEGLNIGSPLILEHTLSAGASVRVSHALQMHIAYTYGIENSLSDNIQTPLGALANTNITQDVSAHLLTAGFSANF